MPAEANFWGFRVRAIEIATGKGHDYRALFLKEFFQSKEQARPFLPGDPLQFLKTMFLERYSEGHHDYVWPVVHDGWVLF